MMTPLRWGQGWGEAASGEWVDHAGGGTRTRKGLLPEVFETSASATSATPATSGGQSYQLCPPGLKTSHDTPGSLLKVR